METTSNNSLTYDLKISGDSSPFWQDFLRRTWSEDRSRDWKIYSTEQFIRFWDTRGQVEHRIGIGEARSR